MLEQDLREEIAGLGGKFLLRVAQLVNNKGEQVLFLLRLRAQQVKDDRNSLVFDKGHGLVGKRLEGRNVVKIVHLEMALVVPSEQQLVTGLLFKRPFIKVAGKRGS